MQRRVLRSSIRLYCCPNHFRAGIRIYDKATIVISPYEACHVVVILAWLQTYRRLHFVIHAVPIFYPPPILPIPQSTLRYFALPSGTVEPLAIALFAGTVHLLRPRYSSARLPQRHQLPWFTTFAHSSLVMRSTFPANPYCGSFLQHRW